MLTLWRLATVAAQLIGVVVFLATVGAAVAQWIEPASRYLRGVVDRVLLCRIDARMAQEAELVEWRRIDDGKLHVAEVDGFLVVRGGGGKGTFWDYRLAIGSPAGDLVNFPLHQRITTTVPVPKGYHYEVRGGSLTPTELGEAVVLWLPRGKHPLRAAGGVTEREQLRGDAD